MATARKKTAITVAALERDTAALTLRKQGLTYDAIAKKLGFYSRSDAYSAVKKRLDALRAECTEVAIEVRDLELTRLDAMLDGLWAKAAKGDPQAVATVLRIQERRSAYVGLDQPKSLRLEMAREHESLLTKLSGALPPEMFEVVLGIISGLDSATGQAPAAEEPATE